MPQANSNKPQPNEHYVIECQGVNKIVPTATGTLSVLQDINLQLSQGESLAVVGRSGSGKSSLLALLAGLDNPSSGCISLCGEQISHLDEDARAATRKLQVGFVFQTFQLLPSLNALENVTLPLELAGEKHCEEKARHWLEQVGLGQRLDHLPNQLSGGEQQRVAIARAFITEPKVLFADEPTGNLDSSTGADIINLLFDLNRECHTTLVLVTHDEQLAARCQRSITLEGGLLL